MLLIDKHKMFLFAHYIRWRRDKSLIVFIRNITVDQKWGRAVTEGKPLSLVLTSREELRYHPCWSLRDKDSPTDPAP